jgi:RNA polymerase sigma-70 factor (ECF subfamily)
VSDTELLARARGGDRTALEALIDQHQPQLYRFGLAMCRNSEDAKDVLQDSLLAMVKGIRDFRGESSLSTWLYSIARSYCIRKRRRSRFAPAAEYSLQTDAAREAAQLADAGAAPDDVLAGREVERALRDAIDALEPRYREVLVLRDVEGLTAPEVAKVLGIGVQAVKSRLHRARLAVRARVAPALGIAPVEGDPAPCSKIPELFSKHLEGDISPSVCAEMERHLAGCRRCDGACESLKRTLALCRASGARTEVPARVQESVRARVREYLAGS